MTPHELGTWLVAGIGYGMTAGLVCLVISGIFIMIFFDNPKTDDIDVSKGCFLLLVLAFILAAVTRWLVA